MGNRPLILIFLFVTALGIRLYRINEPPLDFHATRQYRSLLIARGMYYEGLQDLPEWKKDVARTNRQRQGLLEPPVLERLVATGYRLYGNEGFWISRLLSILFWLVGGGFLYRIAQVISGETAALFSTAFYLLLPFAVTASRSFQPDPLMVMLLLASIYALLRYDDQPAPRRLLVVYGLSAITIFIKPVALFVIFMAFGVLALYRKGIRKALTDPGVLAFFVITPLPALFFYLYGIFSGGTLQIQAQASFLPQLLFDPFYWRGWLQNIRTVVGYIAFLGALLGLMMARQGRPRALLAGLWAGYGAFCLVFNYHIATHDYYHLQLVPIAALSLGPLAAAVAGRFAVDQREWYRRAAVQLVLFLGFGLYLFAMPTMRAAGTNDTKLRVAKDIGRRIQHSTQTVYLASDYGLSLEYHGEISGRPWPLVSDLQWEQIADKQVLEAGDRFQRWFSGEDPEYFIVTDMRELAEQKDLARFLTANYPLLVDAESYRIYSLRK